MSDEPYWCQICKCVHGHNEECPGRIIESSLAAPAGSLAIPSVKTLLAQMMDALGAGDSDKYWAAFEAVMKRHEEVIAEVTGPGNPEVRRGGPDATKTQAG